MLGYLINFDKVVYRATVKQDNSTVNTYTGLTSNSFKKRYCVHRSCFKNENHPNPKTLSEEKKQTKLLKMERCGPTNDFNSTTRKCHLCLKEKYHTIVQPNCAMLNQRT